MVSFKSSQPKRSFRWKERLEGKKQKEPLAISRLRRIESMVSGLPWKWVGALLFAIGCLPLFGYLVVIDYIPPNLLGIIGLASIASIWLLLLWLGTTVVMFGVTVAAFLYEIKKLDWRTTVLGQLGPLCVMICWLFGPQGLWVRILFPICAIGSSFITLVRLGGGNPEKSKWETFLAFAALLLGGTLVSLAVLLVVTHSSMLGYRGSSNGWWTLVSWGGAIAVLICANAASMHVQAAPLAIWTFCFVCSGLMVLILGGPSYVTAAVAARVGLRLPGIAEVMVPMNTCLSAMAVTERKWKLAEKGPVPPCEAASNTLLVEVQLRWGDRWLVAMKSINGMRLPEPSIRMTIPDKDTELILR
ncbi:hypothetical protein [Paracidovorax cattleyae]|uniref:hypothetical protein n=1 Tax=Paracidovorax cattleyae TaxID=80868 RepID=UPI0018AFA085|nr:hypothetical protein [Paracidovorax cattleyae]MBF9264574.1 hypothetical protein [Paracidovorax cattleyae]